MKKHLQKVFLFGCTLLSATLLFVGCGQKKEKNAFFGPVKEVNFDDAMGKGDNEYRFVFKNSSDVERFNTFKQMYQANLPSKVTAGETYKIPKVVHQIWLGPNLPPAYFLVFQEKWKALHPDWEFKLWTDADLDKLNLELRDLIDQSPNWAEKSDILRSELLYRFGGVYFDVDMECNHCLDELNKKFDFWAGLESPHKIATTNNRVWVGISIIASKPKHPIMRRWMDHIRERWEWVNETYTSPIERVINHTYFPFTFSVLEKCHDDDLCNMVFPATYFYPLTCENASKRKTGVRSYREKFYEILEDLHLKNPRPFSRVYPETLATHYWGSSWQSGANDQLKELQTHVSFLKKQLYQMQQRLSAIEKGSPSQGQGTSKEKKASSEKMPRPVAHSS